MRARSQGFFFAQADIAGRRSGAAPSPITRARRVLRATGKRQPGPQIRSSPLLHLAGDFRKPQERCENSAFFLD